MAGMSPSDSEAVIGVLRSLKGRYTTVLIEHDMDAVFALADRSSVLFYGQILVTGTVEDIRNNPLVRDAYLGHDERNA
jgi:branched-chain amino acid transport system ATP-binding protein